MAARAPRAPRTSTLSASGSRKAPEVVAPCRRATHPSRKSVLATAAHASAACPRDPEVHDEHAGPAGWRAAARR